MQWNSSMLVSHHTHLSRYQVWVIQAAILMSLPLFGKKQIMFSCHQGFVMICKHVWQCLYYWRTRSTQQLYLGGVSHSLIYTIWAIDIKAFSGLLCLHTVRQSWMTYTRTRIHVESFQMQPFQCNSVWLLLQTRPLKAHSIHCEQNVWDQIKEKM